MFELRYGRGLRFAELASLDGADVDLTAKSVRVLGKGKKMRVVPVGTKAIQAINAYLPYRTLWQAKKVAKIAKPDDITPTSTVKALFISERHGKRLSERAIQLRRCVPLGQASPRVCTHICFGIVLRRTCCHLVVICVRCRSCWGIAILAPRRFIPMWTLGR